MQGELKWILSIAMPEGHRALMLSLFVHISPASALSGTGGAQKQRRQGIFSRALQT